jgi:ribose transport system substrate-binding protein
MFKKVIGLGLLLILVLSLVACGKTNTVTSTVTGTGSTVTVTSSTASTTSAINISIPFSPPPGDGVLSTLPENVQKLYNGWNFALNKCPYENWPANPKPWKVYWLILNLNDNWVNTSKTEIESIIAKYKAAGYIEEFVQLNANNDAGTQVQHIQTAIEQKADLILLDAASTTGLNAVIKQAYDSGIVVIGFGATADSPYIINTNNNGTLLGANMAAGIVKALNGKGNVLMVGGIAGVSADEQYFNGGNSVFNQNPGIKIVGKVQGGWSPSTAKTVVTQWLATHTEKVDAVWQEGAMYWGIYQALEQSGRPMPILNFADPLASELAKAWEKRNDPNYVVLGSGNPAGAYTDAAFRVGIYTLLGYGPKVNAFIDNPPVITKENLADWYDPSFTLDNMNYVNGPPNTFLSNTTIAPLFNKTIVLPVATNYSN